MIVMEVDLATFVDGGTTALTKTSGRGLRRFLARIFTKNQFSTRRATGADQVKTLKSLILNTPAKIGSRIRSLVALLLVGSGPLASLQTIPELQ